MSTRFAHLHDAGTLTDGPAYDTGLRIRGLEVWAIPPNRYRHFTEFFIQHPEGFATETFQIPHPNLPHLGLADWYVGFTRPDGKKQITFSTYETREEAEKLRSRNPTGRLTSVAAVGYRTAEGNHAEKDTGRPWGVTWADPERDWPELKFELSEEEAAPLLALREEIQAEWESRQAGWIASERQHDQAVAEAVALEAIPAAVLTAVAGPTECLECGATFAEPGHVRSHRMGCDRCGS